MPPLISIRAPLIRFLPPFLKPLLHPTVTRRTKYVIQGFFGVHFVAEYLVSVSRTVGPSMLPNVEYSGEWLVIDKTARYGRGLKVGDMVNYSIPISPGANGVKRVLGLEGDFVEIGTPGSGEGLIQVPEGHCFVVGDNLDASRDSRLFGPIPLGLVRGKVFARLWPLGWIENTLKYPELDDT